MAITPFVRATASQHQRQRGAALVISLIFLMLLTMLAITAVNTSTLQEKMAGNIREAHLAHQNAESGLRAAEAWLTALPNQPGQSAGVPGASEVWATGVPGDYATHTQAWWATNGVPASIGGAATPEYVVEYRSKIRDSEDVGVPALASYVLDVYRMTSHGMGNLPSSQAVAQSGFLRRQ